MAAARPAKHRYFVAAPDASPAQISAGGGYRDKTAAERDASDWNARHPERPVVVWATS